MSEQSYKSLLEKYYNGTASERELQLLEQYADQIIEQSNTEVFLSENDKEVIKNELRDRVKVRPALRLNGWMKVAASIVLVVGLSLTFWLSKDRILSSQMATVSTEAGEQKTVNLPDGSVVSLNGLSSLQYPKEFAVDQRKITFEGEALFEVAKDPKRPFEVNSNGVTTTVLGTTFNINAYSEDSAVMVSLIEGSVRVEGLGQSQLIEPMQQSRFDFIKGVVDIQPFDSTAIMAWKRGDIILARTSFAQLQRLVVRKYGVQIELDKSEMADYTISGKFRNPEINTLLQSICAAKSLQYKETAPNEFLIY